MAMRRGGVAVVVGFVRVSPEKLAGFRSEADSRAAGEDDHLLPAADIQERGRRIAGRVVAGSPGQLARFEPIGDNAGLRARRR